MAQQQHDQLYDSVLNEVLGPTDAPAQDAASAGEPAQLDPIHAAVIDAAFSEGVEPRPAAEGASVSQRIRAEAARVTQQEINERRQRLNSEHNMLARVFYGISPSDEELAQGIAEDRLYPGGLLKTAPQPQSTPATFVRGLIDRPVVTHNPWIGEHAFNLARDLPGQPGSTAETAGAITGEALDIAVAMLVPAAGAPIFAAKASSSSAETFEQTGNPTAAVGAGVIEGLSELLGFRVLGKIGEASATQLGRLVTGGNYSDAVRVASGMLAESGVEIVEEEIALVGQELNLAANGEQSFQQAMDNIAQQALPTAGQSGAVGAMVFIPSLLSPRARRRFRDAATARDERAVREILEAEGIDPQMAGEIAVAVRTPENLIQQAEAEASEIDQALALTSETAPTVGQEVEASTLEQLQEARQEIDQRLAEDDQAEAGERMSGEERANLEFIGERIDQRLDDVAQQQQTEQIAEEAGAGPAVEELVESEAAAPQAQEVQAAQGEQVLSGLMAAANVDPQTAERIAGIVQQVEQAAQQAAEQVAVSQAEPAQEIDQREFTSRNRETKQTKALLERLGLRRPEDSTITQSEALRASLKRQAATSRIAERQTREKMQAEFRTKLNDLRAQARVRYQRLQAESRQRVQAVRKQASQQRQTAAFARGELVRLVREHLPRAEHTRLITDIRDASTIERFEKAVDKIFDVADAVNRKRAIADLRKTVEGFDPRRLRPQIRQRVEQAMAGVDSKSLSDRARAKLIGVAAYVAENPGDALPPSVVKQLDRLAKTPLAELTEQQARDLNDTISALLAQDALIQKLRIRRRLREQKHIVQSIKAELRANLTPRGTHSQTGSARESRRPNLLTVALGKMENLMPRSLIAMISGGEGSTTFQVLYENVDRAQSDMMRGHFVEVDWLNQTLADLGLEPGSKRLAALSRELAGVRNMFSRWWNDSDTKAAMHEIALSDGRTVKLTAAERMHFIASMKDPDTFELVAFKGNPVRLSRQPQGESLRLTFEDVQAIQASATAEELALAQAIFDRINGPLQQTFAQWSIEETGIDRTRPGEYFPRKRTHTATEQVDITMENVNAETPERLGITKERTGGALPIEIRDIFTEFLNYSWGVHGLANMGPALKSARQVLNDNGVSSTIADSTHGDRLRARLASLYDAMSQDITGNKGGRGPIEAGLRPTLGRIGKGLLGLNPRVAMYQPSALIMAGAEMSNVYLLSAVARGAMGNVNIDQRIFAASPYLRHRFEGSAMGLISEGSRTGQAVLGFQNRGDRVMFMIRAMDNASIRVIWRGAELQAEAEGFAGAELQERARQIAERVVKLTQATPDTLHVSAAALEARTSGLARVLTFFRSDVSKQLDMLISSTTAARRKGLAGLPRFLSVASRILATMVYMEGIRELYDGVIKGFEAGEEPDENELAEWTARGIERVSGLVVGGDYAAYLINRVAFPERFQFEPANPLSSLMMDAVEGVAKIGNAALRHQDQNEVWEGLLDTAHAVGALTGQPWLVSPLRQLRQFYEAWIADEEFERDPGVVR